MHSSSHFDPQIGLDIHTYPWPLPTPHIGMVFDPFDYLPYLGTTVSVNGIKRASAGTGGIAVHIPVGGVWIPPLRTPGGPQVEDELFMGSKTVEVDGEPFARITMPVLSCNILGMVPPFRLRRAAKPKPLSLTLPLTFNVALPNNVIVGGPSTINLKALMMRAGLAGLGKTAKKYGKSAHGQALSRSFKALRKKLFKNMPSGTLKCKILRAEPVDIRDGSVSVEHQDFLVAGRVPLAWARVYSSADDEVEGVCGRGWLTPIDSQLEVLADQQLAIATLADGMSLFNGLPAQAGSEHAVYCVVQGQRLWWETSTTGQKCWWFSDADGLRRRFEPYNGQLRLAWLGDSLGNGWQVLRPEADWLTLREQSVEGATGREVLLEFRQQRLQQCFLKNSEDGEVRSLSRYYYDEAQQLSAQVDTLGQARHFRYDQQRLVSHIDRLGQGFHYQYDAQWRVVHAWGDGKVWDYRFEYHDLLNEVVIIDSQGAISRVTFDDLGLPVAELDPHYGNTVFEYDDFGRTLAVIDPDGRAHRWTYTEQGFMASEELPDGRKIYAEYNAAGQLTQFTDAEGACWRNEYDANELPIAEHEPTGLTHYYQYDQFGQLTGLDRAGQASQRYQYDRYGFINAIAVENGGVSRFIHSFTGCLLWRKAATGAISGYQWDKKDRLLVSTNPEGNTFQIRYDAEDQPIEVTDEQGQVTRLAYNGTGMITRCDTPDGGQVAYEYDAEDRLLALINPLGQRWQLTRDALGQVVTETDYWGQSTHYQWDRVGRVSQRQDALGRTQQFAYDRAGRLVSRHSDGQCQARYEYDGCDRMVASENPWRQLRWHYDAAGRLLLDNQDGFTLAYQYDDLGRLCERKSNAGHRVRYQHNEAGRLASIQLNNDSPIVFSYDEVGRCQQEQLSVEVTRTYQYDVQGRLSAQQVAHQQQPLFERGYRYDAVGNITTIRDSQRGHEEYQYDAVGKLIGYRPPDGPLRQFVQDVAGNHLITQPHAQNDSAQGWFRHGQHQGQHYYFDRAGELRIRDKGQGKERFEWDSQQQLISVESNGTIIRYHYDSLGRRIAKQTAQETRWFYWQGDALVGETVTSTDELLQPTEAMMGKMARKAQQAALFTQLREYVYYPGSFQPLAVLTQSEETQQNYHYHCDLNGMPQRLTDVQGEVVWSATHGAWGEVGKTHVNIIENPLRFQGQYFDAETGFHYNRYRYYSPQSAAFISQDPIGMLGGVNPYQYAPNALGWVDPLGLWGSKKKPPHEATATLFDSRGNQKSPSTDWVSGNMTPSESALGFPQSTLATHTEARITKDSSLNSLARPGDTLLIQGQYPPCNSCKGHMNNFKDDTGAGVVYQWDESGEAREWRATGKSSCKSAKGK